MIYCDYKFVEFKEVFCTFLWVRVDRNRGKTIFDEKRLVFALICVAIVLFPYAIFKVNCTSG